MLGLIPLKDWVYLGIIVAIVAFGIYEREHLIHEGEQRCLGREREAAAQQAIADAKINQRAVNDLNSEIASLLGTDSVGATGPPRRVQCYASKVPAPTSQPGAANASSAAAPAGVVQPVPGGTGVGIEVGAGVQRLTLTADILAARYRVCMTELKEP